MRTPSQHERTRQAEPARAPVLAAAARARGPRAADRAAALGLRAPAARRRGALDDRGRAAGLGDAGARRDDPALADGHDRRGREPGEVHPLRDREGALALPGVRGQPRQRDRHPARQGPAALLRRGGVQRARDAAPGGVRAGGQAAERAAEGIPRQPQPHRHRRGRVRRRGGPGHDRGRDRADRGRHRGRVRLRRDRGQHHRRPQRPLPREGGDRDRRTSTTTSAPSFSDEDYDTVGGLVVGPLRAPAQARRVHRRSTASSSRCCAPTAARSTRCWSRSRKPGSRSEIRGGRPPRGAPKGPIVAFGLLLPAIAGRAQRAGLRAVLRVAGSDRDPRGALRSCGRAAARRSRPRSRGIAFGLGYFLAGRVVGLREHARLRRRCLRCSPPSPRSLFCAYLAHLSGGRGLARRALRARRSRTRA